MNKGFQIAKYVLADFLISFIVWILFFFFRKFYLEFPYEYTWEQAINNERFWKGVILVPTCWVLFNSILGLNNNVFRKSRLKEFGIVTLSTFIGCLVIFFVLVLDDVNYSYKAYYKSIAFLFATQLFGVSFLRFIITSITARKVHSKQLGFPTIIIGSGKEAEKLIKELNKAKKSAGYQIIGFVNISNPALNSNLAEQIEHLGNVSQIKSLIEKHKIQEIIIAIEPEENQDIQEIIFTLQDFDIAIKMIPNMYSIMTGQVKMNSILHAALIEIKFGTLPTWQKFLKRGLDVIVSGLVLTVGSPFYLLIALLVKFSSKGPIFFTQERIGKKGIPFHIIKFRSMHMNAEKNGPALSSDKDKRITPIGRFLRKTRLDETPQFYNVLKGDMSLVGPRPERKFFIDQIMVTNPQYKYLHRVKPGITSWGQVKYGYAENIDEMIERLKFDLIYMENMSLLIDFKIMIHTILVVFQGRGK